MAFLLVAYALLIEALLLAVAVFGLFWAPFGALVCARIAKPKGLPVARYTIKGLVYSMLLFFPWVYLVIRMSGRHLPASCTSAGYIALYVCWFAILLVKTVPGSNAIIGILQAMLLVVSIVQFYFIPSNNRMARADEELNCVYLSPFFYMSIGLYAQLFYNLITRGRIL